MSIPYLIHKKDADLYDRIEKDRKQLDQESDAFMDSHLRKYITHIGDKPFTFRGVESIVRDVTCTFEYKYKKLEEEGKHIKAITMFEPTPSDPENYYTYYRGFRWGEAAKDDGMISIAKNGIASIYKAIGRKKD